MKTILTIAALVLAISLFGQPPCPQDSICGGGSGVGAIDTSVVQEGVTYCTDCPTQGSVSWTLPNDFNGYIYLLCPNGTLPSSIQVVQDCQFVLFDTCVVLPQNYNNGFFSIGIAIIGNAQIYINGQVGDSIVIDCKSTPFPQEALEAYLLDLATCQLPLPIQDDLSDCGSFQYIDLLNPKQHTTDDQNTLPRGIYWQYCGTVANGKKIAIFGH